MSRESFERTIKSRLDDTGRFDIGESITDDEGVTYTFLGARWLKELRDTTFRLSFTDQNGKEHAYLDVPPEDTALAKSLS